MDIETTTEGLIPTPVVSWESSVVPPDMISRFYKFVIRRGAKPWFNIGDHLKIITEDGVVLEDKYATCCSMTLLPFSSEDEYTFRT